MILGYGVAASEASGKSGYHAYHSDEQISGQQVTYNAKNDIHFGTLEERLILGANQQLKAGVSKDVILEDLENNYKMIDKLNRNKASEIEAGKLPELTYNRENIENNLQEGQQKSTEKHP